MSVSIISQGINPWSDLKPGEVELQPSAEGEVRPPRFTDEGAAKLVMQDCRKAEQWLDQRQWALQWRETDVLYQSPRALGAFEGSAGVSRANVSRFTVLKHTNALTPEITAGLFYDSPPFLLRPRGQTTQATSRAKSILYAALLEEMEFENECDLLVDCGTLNGTGIAKAGGFLKKTLVKRFKRKESPLKLQLPFGEREFPTVDSDEMEVTEEIKTAWRPFFEFKMLGEIFPAPSWNKPNQIHKAKYICERRYVDMRDLAELREQGGWEKTLAGKWQWFGYVVPSEQELKDYFWPPQTPIAGAPSQVLKQQDRNQIVHHAEGQEAIVSEDPTLRTLELIERWDDYTVKVVLVAENGRVLSIRDDEHGLPEWHNKPYFSWNFINIQNAGFGIGTGRLVGSDQRVEQGTMNAALDILSFGVNPQALVARGANVPSQAIRTRLGGIMQVDLPEGMRSVRDAMAWMEMPKTPPEAWEVLNVSKQNAESLTGADEAMVQGALPKAGGSSIGRTATGAGGLQAASARRIQGPVGHFIKGVFVPFLKFLDWMVNEFMPITDVREILGQELGEDYALDTENFLNASLKIEVLAGARLAAKKAMAQSLPLMVQILENPQMLEQLHQIGWTIDIRELFEMFMEMSEWKNSRQVIRKLTPQEAQLFQAMNSAKSKMQGQMALQQDKAKSQKEMIDQKAESKLGSDILMHALESGTERVSRQAVMRAEEPEALGGEAGGSYQAAL